VKKKNDEKILMRKGFWKRFKWENPSFICSHLDAVDENSWKLFREM
jgi:hypothetical protein